jgi:hypothetical protein
VSTSYPVFIDTTDTASYPSFKDEPARQEVADLRLMVAELARAVEALAHGETSKAAKTARELAERILSDSAAKRLGGQL